MNTTKYKDYKSKEKTLIKQDVFWEQLQTRPTWKNIKHLDLQDDDEIIISYEEYMDGDGDYYYISIERWVEETDEEFEKRLKFHEEKKEVMKKMRYESYIKLKAEFENNENI